MNENMVLTLFHDVQQYMKFLFLQNETAVTKDSIHFAVIEKKGEKFFYTLFHREGPSISEYIRPFFPCKEYIDIFNTGCFVMAERLKILIETKDVNKVPSEPLAFGILSYDSPDTLAPIPPIPTGLLYKNRKYFPIIKESKLVKNYINRTYDIKLLTDVICYGMIQCPHILIAYKKGEEEPSYVVASEINNSYIPGAPTGSHYLGAYPGEGHLNYGSADEFGNLDVFEKEAIELLSEALKINIKK
jgi:hypothetical protein